MGTPGQPGSPGPAGLPGLPGEKGREQAVLEEPILCPCLCVSWKLLSGWGHISLQEAEEGGLKGHVRAGKTREDPLLRWELLL